MGDKTQIATVLSPRASRSSTPSSPAPRRVLLAEVPAVLFGDRVAQKVPARVVHVIAAVAFAGISVLVLSGGNTDALAGVRR